MTVAGRGTGSCWALVRFLPSTWCWHGSSVAAAKLLHLMLSRALCSRRLLGLGVLLSVSGAAYASSSSESFFSSTMLKKLLKGQQPAQAGLVHHLMNKGVLRKSACISVMQKVDRKHFVPPGHYNDDAIYTDAPLPIGAGQTISAPHMHAIALDLLEDQLKPGARVLDVGSGSGYLTACMALMVQPGGWVLGVEKVPELAVRSIDSINTALPDLDSRCWSIRAGNVLQEELSSLGPFAAIHVGAAADELHQQLIDVLAPGGRMVIPLGPRWGRQVGGGKDVVYLTFGRQVLLTVDKDQAGQIHTKELMDVGYVPLLRPAEMEDGYQAP